MTELRDLYQEVILDHSRRPRNFRRPERYSAKAEGHNPLCGDRVEVFVRLDPAGTIEDVAFQGSGCAISTASASMMTEVLRGRSAEDATRLFSAFHHLLTESGDPDPSLGKLEVFAGVREFPVRVKCATLPWHTLRAAMEHREEPVSTE